jgi:adenylylsulfate kinase
VREYHKRSVVKAISWRVVATVTTVLVVYGFTRELALAAGVGAVEVVAKLLFYYFHERLWHWIPWGKLQHPLSGLAVSRELEPDHLEEIRTRLEDLGYL